ncbi:MAG TPA: hypothetical protein VEK08_16565 [Planctomycetota bacterium]|nr:hypothetical protein [Planctomycetota bacterium]
MKQSFVLLLAAILFLAGCEDTADKHYSKQPPEVIEAQMAYAPKTQTAEQAAAKSKNCQSCHKIENQSMHKTDVGLGCTDCHGGNPNALTKEEAHVQPRGPWYGHAGSGSANPKRSGHVWMSEDPAFVRFVNPGDLRVAEFSCGKCHDGYAFKVKHSMMAHGAMLWNAALYNNGAINQKYARFGEAYTIDGRPARLLGPTVPGETEEQARLRLITKGELPWLDPLPRYNITQPGNVLRSFERGGRLKLETALLDKENEAGKPEFKLSTRGFGTQLRTDPVFLGLQKTRLLDPMLWHLGTNDHSGDYRSSGCSACHVVYANDRDPAHSGPYAKFGKHGFYAGEDATIPKNEPGHPIRHELSKNMPSSQCVVCHMHPGTTVTMTYYGNLWYDNESEGATMYPPTQLPKKTEEQNHKIEVRNSEGAARRGNWSDPKFLDSLADKNKTLSQLQFADYNGHGWIFRNVYKMDRKGNLLDKDDKVVAADGPEKFNKGENGEPLAGHALHMQDIHQERGMHCVDCHFSQDTHGNGKLYGEVRNATSIMCIDCHGTVTERAKLTFSGNAAPDAKENSLERTRRFKWVGDTLIQTSAMDPAKQWKVPQVVDVINPASKNYNVKAAYAKTIRRDNKTWGDVPKNRCELAHQNEKMDCYTCHTAWTASCFGCHLPMRANQRRENNHYEGAHSRNWTQYNFQTLRDDVFMLGVEGAVKGGFEKDEKGEYVKDENGMPRPLTKIAPVRSSCAVLVSSQNAQREWIYSQQQTVSAEGFSGHAFSPHFPHAVRSKETKNCTDCHLSSDGDNNAWMAQVLMQGTNQTNFMSRYVYVGCKDHGLAAVVVAEQDEPQAVIGSTLHKDAYPEEYKKHVAANRELTTIHHHHGRVENVQLRGEYVYAAAGKSGLIAYDVANIDNKGFSERIITAPVSPLGQNLRVDSDDCSAVLSPSVLAVDPTRQPPLRPRDPLNFEQPISLVYAFLYGLDRKEGLFTVPAGTLLDGDPTNNFLKRHATFNPDGILNGAVNGVVAGNDLFVCADRGLVVVDISGIGSELIEAGLKLKAKQKDPNAALEFKDVLAAAGKPPADQLKIKAVIPLNKPRAVRIQFRYAFVVDADGLKVIDITNTASPRLIERARVPYADAQNVYLARTYAYVAAGKEGLGIVDIEKPEQPKELIKFTAGGILNDVHDVKIAMTNVSLFAYIANGRNGLAVVQLTAAGRPKTYQGWSPEPSPELIATKKLPGEAVSISEGIQRERAVDESGNQIAVFNRVGARPLNKEEAQRMYMRNGELFTVKNPRSVDVKDFEKEFGTPNKFRIFGRLSPALQRRVDELREKIAETDRKQLDEWVRQTQDGAIEEDGLRAKLDSLKKQAAPAKGDDDL